MKVVEGFCQKVKEGKLYYIVLMDVMMLVLDGYEVMKLICKDFIEDVCKIFVIVMIVLVIQGDREKCLVVGMNDYFVKLVWLEVFKKKLDIYFNGLVGILFSVVD